MSRSLLPRAVVGNEFVLPRRQLPVVMPIVAADQLVSLSSVPVEAVAHREHIPVSVEDHQETAFARLLELMHRHSLVTFALLFTLVSTTGIQVGAGYWSAHLARSTKPAAKIKVPSITGLNLAVPSDQLEARLQTITGQTATLNVGDQVMTITPDTIKSWLQITPSADKSQDYIRIKSDAIAASLTDMANQVVKAPVDQVTITHDGVSRVVVTGRDGVKLTDPNGLKLQATTAAKTVMDGKGLQFNAPSEVQAFSAVGVEAFDKLIEADVTSKQMWLYEKGQLVKTYAVSAGAPATPTVLGEYHIYSKLAVQDMRGYNANGTKYFQPHVHWISYFYGAYAVHGVYWHPQSWFGAINSSHGCVGLPDYDAEWVYNWAPVGTTVITHA